MEANLKFSVIFSLNCCQLILYRWSAAMLLLLVEFSENSTLDGRMAQKILLSRNHRIDREKYCDKLSTTCVIKELVLKRKILDLSAEILCDHFVFECFILTKLVIDDEQLTQPKVHI